MIKEKIVEIIMEIPERFKGITKAHYEYYKAATYEQFVIVISGISILTILFLLGSLFLVFFTFGLAFYIGFLLGNYAWGFMILAGFYLLTGFIVYRKRGPWIVDPVVRMMELVFYSDSGLFDKLIKRRQAKKDEEAKK
jgi:hypothetical protein